jgi:hypothetical protein
MDLVVKDESASGSVNTLGNPRPAWWRRSVNHPKWNVAIVDEADWVSQRDARKSIGLRQPWFTMLIICRELKRAATHEPPWYDFDMGFTRESVDRQVAFWRGLLPWKRMQEKCKLLLAAVVNGI